eukprot:Sspe_Gene.91899::Locus_63548_Transcript_1_1_Confidence_1.000_Length_4256::g.91899::m.91899/K10408/DNAH; dynein heavy chain, axonemal
MHRSALPPIGHQPEHSARRPHPPTAQNPHTDYSNVKLRTAHDAINFFRDTPKPPFKFVYCNRQSGSLTFRPYDLLVTLRGEQEPEHWVVSPNGVVHVRPFAPPELHSVAEWEREAHLFDRLSQLPFFNRYLIYKAFLQWKRNVRYSLFLQARTRCCKRLFLSKHTFAKPLADLHRMAFDVCLPSLVAYPISELVVHRTPCEHPGIQLSSNLVLTGVGQGPAQRAPVEKLLAQSRDWRLTHINGEPVPDMPAYQNIIASQVTTLRMRFGQKVHYELKEFKDKQNEQRDQAETEFACTMGAMRDKLTALCQQIAHSAHVPDLTTVEQLEDFISAHTMVPGDKGSLYKAEREAEKQERKRALKKVMIEFEFLGNFIRLCDYMVLENLYGSVLRQVERFVAHERQHERSRDLLVTFEITCQFDAQRNMVLVPSHVQLQEAFRILLTGVVKEADNVMRLPRVIEEQVKEKLFHTAPDLTPLEHILRDDSRFLALQSELEAILLSCFERAQAASLEYKGCRACRLFIDEEWKTEYKRWTVERDTLTSADFSKYIKRVKNTFKAELERMHDSDHGILHIHIKKLTAELLQPLELILDQIKTTLLELATKRAQEIAKQAHEKEGSPPSLESMKQRLEEKRITPLKYFAEWVRDCNRIYERQNAVNHEVNEIEELFKVADQTGFNILYQQLGARNDMIDERDKFNQLVEASKERRKKELGPMLAQLREAIEEENKKLSGITKELSDPKSDYKNPKSPTQFILEVKLGAVNQQLQAIKSWIDTLSEWQVLFEQQAPAQWPAYIQAEKLYNEKYDLWSSLAKWEEKRRTWGSTPLDQLDMADVKQQIEELYQKAYKMNKADGDGVTEKLLNLVGAEKQHLPVMENVGNKALRDRHWEKIFEGIGKKQPAERTLDSLRAMGVFGYPDIIQQVSSVATGEWGVQRDLDAIRKVWEDPEEGLAFFVKNHREQDDVFVLGGLDEIIEKLEDNQVSIQTCLASRWVAGIRADVEEWDEKLKTTADVLEEWLNLQKAWMYLEFIFASDDIKKQLPEESRLFAKVDDDFRSLMKRAHQNPNVLPLATDPDTLPMLRRDNEVLDKVQKRLEDYLETKRMAFPRFYFLSNDELLEILSDVRNPLQVCKHLQKCFDNMKGLNFSNPPDSDVILAMVSSEGEVVPFTSPVKAVGNVEHWLTDIERNMRKTLYDVMAQTLQAYPQHARAEWYFMFPAQCISCVDVIVWTSEMEEVWARHGDGQDDALDKYIESYQQQILATVDLVKTDLTSLQRTLVCCLLVVDVHARSVMDDLKKDNCVRSDDFNWQKQLRYYWTNNNIEGEPQDCWIGHSSANILYGYEYLGNQPRLVITPLTERAFLTCTGALHMNLGAAPQGPAGTGKTESVKDLGKALARQVVVFNCSDGLN